MNKILSLTFILISNLYFLQSVKKFQIPDTLKNKSFDQLEKSYGNVFRSGDQSVLYANTFLTKAKKEKNIIKQIDGYFLLFTKSTKEIKYVDSIQNIIKTSVVPDELSYGNYKIGNIYFNSNKYKKALSSYLTALTFAKKNNNSKNIVLIKNAIGKIKYLTYDYEEALKIFKENYDYLKEREKKDPNNYLDILYSLTLSYNAVGKNDSAYTFASLGRSKCILYDKKYYFRIFDLGYNATKYYLKDYRGSIKGLENNIDFFKKYDHSNLGITYMYLSMNFQKLNDKPKYLYNFNKMDSLQKDTKFIDLHLIDLYKNSLKYYEQEGDKEKQVYLIDRLIKLNDTIYKSNHEFSKEVHQKFDTPELLEQKEKLISSLGHRSMILYWISGGGFLLLFVFIFLYSTNQKKLKIYKAQAEKLVEKQNESLITEEIFENHPVNLKIDNPSSDEDNNITKNQIPENVKQAIILKLNDFEKQKKFIENNINLHSLSKDFETNRVYLSKVINEIKGKSFSNYLNELRINFVVTELKQNKKLRLKTIAAISEEVGFNNVESFAKAFKNVTSTLPSYYIKVLKEKDGVEN